MIQNFNLSKKKQPVLSYLSFIGTAPFTLKTNNVSKNWNGILEYSTDGTIWSTWNGTEISSVNNSLHLRGTGNGHITGENVNDNGRFVFTTSGTIQCIGNIETLLDYSSVLQSIHPTMDIRCYQGLFKSCPLTTPPELPSLVLTNRCYRDMFDSCYSLQFAPSLPATVLTDFCYYGMFSYCNSLIEPPQLKSTSLAEYCYGNMFSGCRNIEKLPELPAVTLAEYCYEQMFYNCYKIKISETLSGEYQNEFRIPSSGTGTAPSNATNGMFTGSGGTFAGTPSINTTYYTSNEIVPAS